MTRLRAAVVCAAIALLGCQEHREDDGERSAHSVNRPVLLDLVYDGSAGTVVFIHGHHNCVGTEGADAECSADPLAYWSNGAGQGGDGASLLDHASGRVDEQGAWTYQETFTIRYDGVSQPVWDATADVAACLVDLAQGKNDSGCNPKQYRRASFRLVGHSEGGAIIDRIFSTGWWPERTSENGAVVGSPVTLAGALAGAKSASALYGVDGASNFCTTLVGAAAGWAFRDPGSASLTRGSMIGEANNGKAGKSPRWIYKTTTSGGRGSCNNASVRSVRESTNDFSMGLLCGCIGYSRDDDADGIVWQYDSDPTSDPEGSNGGKYRAQFTGYYWRWLATWANHSHSRNDAYVARYGAQTHDACNAFAPGTCIGQFAW